MSMFLDIGPLSCACTDHALEEMHKSLADPPGEGIWRPHEDPYITRLIETASARMLGRFAAIAAAITNPDAYFRDQERVLGKSVWDRIDEDTLTDIERDLAWLSPDAYSLQDWLNLVDVVLHRYLPEDVVADEADYLAVRSVIAGRVKAHTAGASAADVATMIASILPGSYAQAERDGLLHGVSKAVVDFARARAGELIRDLKESMRGSIKRTIIDHEQRKAMGEQVHAGTLQQRLFDKFGEINRDWRRIALTEASRDANEGFLSTLKPGSKVRRLEAYDDACPFCKRIHRMVFDVVDPGKANKDGWKEVWIGKTNEGRSASPRKRVGDELVERTPAEMWWPAAGAQHPNCRGVWEQVENTELKEDPDFAKWLLGRLAETRP